MKNEWSVTNFGYVFIHTNFPDERINYLAVVALIFFSKTVFWKILENFEKIKWLFWKMRLFYRKNKYCVCTEIGSWTIGATLRRSLKWSSAARGQYLDRWPLSQHYLVEISERNQNEFRVICIDTRFSAASPGTRWMRYS